MILSFGDEIKDHIASFLDHKDLMSLNLVNKEIKIDIDIIMIMNNNDEYISKAISKRHNEIIEKCVIFDINFNDNLEFLFSFAKNGNIEYFRHIYCNHNLLTEEDLFVCCLNAVMNNNFEIYKYINKINYKIDECIPLTIINKLIIEDQDIKLEKFLIVLEELKVLDKCIEVYDPDFIDYLDLCIVNEYENCLSILIRYKFDIYFGHLCTAIENSSLAVIAIILPHVNPFEHSFYVIKLAGNSKDILRLLWKDVRIQLYLKCGKIDILPLFKNMVS